MMRASAIERLAKAQDGQVGGLREVALRYVVVAEEERRGVAHAFYASRISAQTRGTVWTVLDPDLCESARRTAAQVCT